MSLFKKVSKLIWIPIIIPIFTGGVLLVIGMICNMYEDSKISKITDVIPLNIIWVISSAFGLWALFGIISLIIQLTRKKELTSVQVFDYAQIVNYSNHIELGTLNLEGAHWKISLYTLHPLEFPNRSR